MASVSSSSNTVRMAWMAAYPAFVPGAKLQAASCILDVVSEEKEDGLSEDPSQHLPNPDWPHSWILIEGDESA